ncbi:methylamine utilization protein [Pseudomonas marginalis]|uniref:methylamine utilization protein n=1 Tax=Pseudomonas marginalis TaxID=298 RepID=UPI002A35D328|nr:methylamine utilization protein [Pseudomonas marginalis]WPN24864.1 methylamine utilization protein [Pseudomonas marginalis]
MARIFHLLSRAALLLAAAGPASAATLEVAAYQADGRPVADAVVTLRGPADAPQGVLKADMDQRGQRFAPHVLAVHTGTQVRFPNSDNIRHQVYSFSAAKRFELRLYEGTPTDPLLFDKPGVVVLGCNIHDWMLGYIYVTDDPRFGVSDAQGRVHLEHLPAGDYHLTLWHPQLADRQPLDGGTLHIPAAGLSHRVVLSLEPAPADLPPAPSAFGDAFNRAAHETAQ